jgi:hypothetical protein
LGAGGRRFKSGFPDWDLLRDFEGLQNHRGTKRATWFCSWLPIWLPRSTRQIFWHLTLVSLAALALLGCQSPLQDYIAEHSATEATYSSETTIATKGKVAVAVVRPATAQILAAIVPPNHKRAMRERGIENGKIQSREYDC